MDPLTHTFVGASLAASGLGRRSRYASAALVIGANLPDVDVLSYVAGGDAALCARRGWTHGVLALVVLPALLAATLVLWRRWRRSRDGVGSGAGSPAAWLFGLSYLAVLTHPVLDWLNTYGMRWFMPFSDTWFYGDALFIIDPWLWLLLGAAWLFGRVPTPARVGTLAAVAVILASGVGSRAPSFVPLVLCVAATWMLMLLVQPRSEEQSSRVAVAGLVSGALYIGVMLTLQSRAEAATWEILEVRLGSPPESLMVGPVPADPLSWDVVALHRDELRWGRFSWRQGARLTQGHLTMSDGGVARAESLAVWSEIVSGGQVSGFLDWARYPWLERENTPLGRTIYVMDARYARTRTTGFGGARIDLPARGGGKSQPSRR